jgi:hypothetical protein
LNIIKRNVDPRNVNAERSEGFLFYEEVSESELAAKKPEEMQTNPGSMLE